MEIIQDVKQARKVSAYIALPFDEAKKELENAGYQVISLEQNAGLRIHEGKDADISSGNWTREGFIYVPNKGTFLTKKSPIMADAKSATKCHKKRKEFYLTSRQIEEALSDSVMILPVSVIIKGELFVPTNRFAENEVTVYAFGKKAEAYGQFLKSAGICEMPIGLADITNKAFARQVYFGGLDDDSELCGCDSGLHNKGWLRGMREKGLTNKLK